MEDCFTVRLTIQTSINTRTFKSSSSVNAIMHLPIEVQSTVVPDVTTAEVNQCVIQKGHEKNRLKQCPAQDDIVVQDRKCQKMKSAHMQPKDPKSSYIASHKNQ